MLTARFMQGNLYNSPEASWNTYNLLDCFATMQASVGGGYSVNFVPWHKDPVEARDKGLRNLTINLTAMPVLTVFNYLKTTAYEMNNDGQKTDEKVTKILCYPMPNYIGSAAISRSVKSEYTATSSGEGPSPMISSANVSPSPASTSSDMTAPLVRSRSAARLTMRFLP